MKISARRESGFRVLKVTGKMLIGSEHHIGAEFSRLLEAGESKFVFDLVSVPFIDSAAIGELVACYKRAKDHGAVVLLALNQRAHDLFVLYELHKVFRIFPSVSKALESRGGMAVAV